MDIRSWLSQATTGGGIAALLGTASALAAGQLSLHQAIPVLVAGVVGLIWPENSGSKAAAETAATSIETLVTAYRFGLQHGVTSGSTPTIASPAGQAESAPLK